MGPEALAQVLRPLSQLFDSAEHPDLLVGLSGADDAAVFRRSNEEALVVTTDFFTPVVDDPYDYGAIAAANAMSDVFAMGGQVLLALNLLAFPEGLDPAIAREVVRGGAEMVRVAGGVVAGGHSVYDKEPKFGLAVVGRVHPQRILRKAGARPGDVLLLTKPLGSGLVTTALKRGTATEAQREAVVASMRELNRAAGAAAGEVGASAATDITGFGLIGHGLELTERSGVRLRIDPSRLPLLPGAWELALAGTAPGGTGRNLAAYASRVDGLDALPERFAWADLLFDPQTSGGLLVALSRERISAFRAAMGDEGRDVAEIGVVEAGAGITLEPS